ncbi:MAG: OmpA family protein [Chitinophagaceae bacterium]|nr:OmpA family protein [Chitinophagaceae bacterium]
MKKILAALLAMSAFIPSGFAQDDEIRPAAVGISFSLTDFQTASRIRTTSLSQVLGNKRWAKFREMSPGLGINYFKGLKKHIDFAASLNGTFTRYPFPNKPLTSSEKFLLSADATMNFKMFSEKFWVQPYLIAGLGGHMYGGTYFGAYIPTGLGMKVNFYDETHLFITSQYRIPVTTETANYHFLHSIGIAGRVGKKKEPKVIEPPKPPVDTDKDGIIDSLDKCPTVPGLKKYDGCPVPDTDKDGINDEEDKCPTVPGLARYQGCPIPDTDKDGINDEEDKCPTVPGLARYQGCPLTDTDGDTVPDEEDKCPTEKGLPENNGCPTLEQFKFDAGKVQFVTGSATLTKVAMAELDKGAKIMQEHPTLNVSVEGHTDNTGTPALNQKLSEKRAAAVKAYLVKKGVSADRLTTAGYGQTQPVGDNKTSAGRAANRRVEFKIGN